MTDCIEHVLIWKKKLEKGCNDEKKISILRQLKKIPVNVEILQKTGIGKLVRGMKNSGGEIGATAQAIYNNWKKAVIDSSQHKNKEEKHTSSHTDTHKMKPKVMSMENRSDFHSSKRTVSKEHREIASKHQSSSKADIKYKHTVGESNGKQFSKSSSNSYVTVSMNSACDSDSDSEDLGTATNYSVSKKTVSSNENRMKLKTHEVKEHSARKHKTDSSDYEKPHKQLKDSHKRVASDTKPLEQETRTKHKKAKLLQSQNESFDCSNATFEDILGLNDAVSAKKKRPLQNSQTPVRNVSHNVPRRESAGHALTKPRQQAASTSLKTDVRQHTGSISLKNDDDDGESASIKYPEALKKPKLLPLEEVDILSTLPPIQPNYKPLPHIDLDSFSKKRKTTMSNEEAIMFTTPRRDRTAVYAGRRNIDGTQSVRSLYDLCTRVLIENVDALAYTGGVPYHILKPVLQVCTPVQLFSLETYNPDLVEDTSELWKIHSEREFKGHTPKEHEHETWRDLYLRKFDEREEKLKAVTANISASMARTTNVRQTKLAYVDSVAKPPRDVARRQAKHGTGLPFATTQKAGPPSKATPRPSAPVVNAISSSPVPSMPPVQQKKPKVAPLMQKSLKLMKHLRR